LIEEYIEIDKNTRKAKLYTDNAQLREELIYNYENIDNIYFIGSYKEYYDGIIRTECNFNENGELDGNFIKYNHSENNTVIKCFYVNGKLNNAYTISNSLTNDIIDFRLYNNGVSTYRVEYYQNNNKKKEFITMENNVSKFIEYFESGSIQRIYFMKNFKYIDKYLEYHPNGTLYKVNMFISE
jgi:antitoxin component YwqK of YwqJK toxin-antitoxin module